MSKLHRLKSTRRDSIVFMQREYPKFRVYALIHGPIISVGDNLGVSIKKMSFEEQHTRGFSPVQYVFTDVTAEEGYQTYITSLPFVDNVKIKSEYVAICSIHERDENAAIGGAFREFDRLCRYLSISNLHDVRTIHGGKVGGYLPYMYQVMRVYSVAIDGTEKEIEITLRSGHVYLPNRPDKNSWRDDKTGDFLHDISSFHDDTLEQALKYLYRSSIGGMLLDSPEKIALDHVKSIEIIINALSKKGKFHDRLEEAASLIGITDDEQKEIKKFWKSRSELGDVAHASKYDQAARYPNQFPLPSNVQYPWAGHGWVASDIVLKYFNYRRRVFRVEVGEPYEYIENGYKTSSDGTFGQINPMWESNRYFMYSKEGNKPKLMKKAVQALAEELGISENIIHAKMGNPEHGMKVIWLTVTPK